MDGFFGKMSWDYLGGSTVKKTHKSTKKLMIRSSGSTIRVLYYFIYIYILDTPYLYTHASFHLSLRYLRPFPSVASTVGRSNDFCFHHGDGPSSKLGFMRLLGVPLVELVVP